MPLDDSQLQLVKEQAREVSAELERMPFDQASKRCEFIAHVLALIGQDEAAEVARHLAYLLGEGKTAHDELQAMLLKLR